MTTRFILHGGFNPNMEKQENDLFFSEMLSIAPEHSTILLVYFAKETEKWNRYKQDDVEQFERNKDGRDLDFIVADKNIFKEQIKAADIIYFRGGKTISMLEALKEFPNLGELLRGKTVGADSAGTNALSSVFFSSSLGIKEGMGVVPVKVICHGTEENKNKLNKVRSDLETVFLREYQFKIFEF